MEEILDVFQLNPITPSKPTKASNLDSYYDMFGILTI